MTKPFAAQALLIGRDNLVLGVTRRNDFTKWGLPGGKIDPGEEPEDAALRELNEETGYKYNSVGIQELHTGIDDTGNLVVTYLVEMLTPRTNWGLSLRSGDFEIEPGIRVSWKHRWCFTDPRHSPFSNYNKCVFEAYDRLKP